MLSQFTVKNYKSFRDEMTFDMQAVAISEHVGSLIDGKDGEKYLPISAIYGPNGGGKSNVLEAMNSLVSLVVKPIITIHPQNALYYYDNSIIPFEFSEESKESPTEYELFFSTDNAEYRYVLKATREAIVTESLDRIKFDTKRKSALFMRSENEITMKGDLQGLKINETISSSIPLLSYLGITYDKNPVVKDVIGWFLNGIVFMNYGLLTQETKLYLGNTEVLKPIILDVFDKMGIDITDYRLQKEGENSFQLYTTHTVDGNNYELRINEESTGTVKIFELLPILVYGLTKGQTIIIDELDSRLHPLLLKYIIQLFSDRSINKRGAQLIFTSQDMSTMNNEVFRRDEIWFVAKGNEQNSMLYSLVEFKNDKGEAIRKDARYDKQYLEGKYGADPYLNKMIDWGTINA